MILFSLNFKALQSGRLYGLNRIIIDILSEDNLNLKNSMLVINSTKHEDLARYTQTRYSYHITHNKREIDFAFI